MYGCFSAWTFAPMALPAALHSHNIFSPLSHGDSAPQSPELQIHSFDCSHQELTLQILLTYFISVKSGVHFFEGGKIISTGISGGKKGSASANITEASLQLLVKQPWMFWGLVARGEWLQCINIAVRRRNSLSVMAVDQVTSLAELFWRTQTIPLAAKALFRYWALLACINMPILYLCYLSWMVESGCLNSCMQSIVVQNQARKWKLWKCQNSFQLKRGFKKTLQVCMFPNLCTGIFCVESNSLCLVLYCTPLGYALIYLAVNLLTFKKNCNWMLYYMNSWCILNQ